MIVANRGAITRVERPFISVSSAPWTRFSLSARAQDVVLASLEAGYHALRTWMQQYASDETRQSV